MCKNKKMNEVGKSIQNLKRKDSNMEEKVIILDEVIIKHNERKTQQGNWESRKTHTHTEMLEWEKSVKQIKNTMQNITRFIGSWLQQFLEE